MFLKNYFLKEKLKQNSYFIWNSQKKNIQTIKEFTPLDLKLIIGVDNQKEILLKNTVNSVSYTHLTLPTILRV